MHQIAFPQNVQSRNGQNYDDKVIRNGRGRFKNFSQ